MQRVRLNIFLLKGDYLGEESILLERGEQGLEKGAKLAGVPWNNRERWGNLTFARRSPIVKVRASNPLFKGGGKGFPKRGPCGSPTGGDTRSLKEGGGGGPPQYRGGGENKRGGETQD